MAIFSLISSAIGSLSAALGTGATAAGTTAAGAAGAAASATPGIGSLTGLAGLVGTGVSTVGAIQQMQGQRRAEELRKKQLNLESDRQRRQVIRQSLIARAQATSNAVAQGADTSSGLQGGLSQVQGQAASNIQGINQGQTIGLQMFDANKTIASGGTLQSIGSGIQNFGSYLASNYETNRRVFGFA